MKLVLESINEVNLKNLMVNLFDSMNLNYLNSCFRNCSLLRETEISGHVSFFLET